MTSEWPLAYRVEKAMYEIASHFGVARSVQIKFGAAVPRDYPDVFLDVTKITKICGLPVEFPEMPSFFDDWVEIRVEGNDNKGLCYCVAVVTARELVEVAL